MLRRREFAARAAARAARAAPAAAHAASRAGAAAAHAASRAACAAARAFASATSPGFGNVHATNSTTPRNITMNMLAAFLSRGHPSIKLIINHV